MVLLNITVLPKIQYDISPIGKKYWRLWTLKFESRITRERTSTADRYPCAKESKRAPATINRYMASLSGFLSYACPQLRWIDENPCFNLIKLKESSGRDRILTDIARIANVSHDTVNKVEKIINLGSKEDQKKVELGEISINAMARKLKNPGDGKSQTASLLV